jgi:hypothetical protein
VSKSKLSDPGLSQRRGYTTPTLTDQHEKILNIQFGKPGCDNKIAYIYTILGYDVINDPPSKSYHYHRQQTRDYGFKDKIPEPYLFVSWYPYG